MITARAFAGKRYAVYGLARSGRATVEALLASGAEVVAWDEKPEAREALTAHDALSFADPLTLDLTGFAGVVVSPGVPINKHPIAPHARKHGVPLIGDIELFALARPELPPHKVVGITGTNGKSTTTALVHHILKTAGVPTTMGGNIGLPILAQDPLPKGGVYVLELSSYQIDLTYSLDCDVAVLLNITPDHLDRYEGLGAYADAKARLFAMQSPRRTIVLDNETDAVFGSAEFANDPLIAFYDLESFDGELGPALQGSHNRANALAAIAACRDLGVADESIHNGLLTYPGLPHRMEQIRERVGVLFVNDSKATNPDSAAPALAAYPDIHWILGGLAKTDSLGPCEPHLDHVRGAYTIGESGPMFARLLRGRVPVTEAQV
ncbi:MAG TPA: UDP-N-acetylmuramoyl-L-alanine--D-glutamate ligase, partial [Allosphingosinicella sp.]|nr:UDP-N-acetylmuramoyl-L-alanine--D-glutamate ligase [Allosphingosinicella sp.]